MDRGDGPRAGGRQAWVCVLTSRSHGGSHVTPLEVSFLVMKAGRLQCPSQRGRVSHADDSGAWHRGDSGPPPPSLAVTGGAQKKGDAFLQRMCCRRPGARHWARPHSDSHPEGCHRPSSTGRFTASPQERASLGVPSRHPLSSGDGLAPRALGPSTDSELSWPSLCPHSVTATLLLQGPCSMSF